jgi:hypothetical protein
MGLDGGQLRLSAPPPVPILLVVGWAPESCGCVEYKKLLPRLGIEPRSKLKCHIAYY